MYMDFVKTLSIWNEFEYGGLIVFKIENLFLFIDFHLYTTKRPQWFMIS